MLLVSPTGSGKTEMMMEIMRRLVARGGKAIFLAHRKELIDSPSMRLDRAGIDHGVIMSGHKRVRPWCQIQVASIQTLTARMKRGLPEATLVVYDEAHHARSESGERLLAQYPNAHILGASATPWRKDGLGLGHLFDDVVVAATPGQLIRDGFLVPYTGFVYDAPELARVRVVASDYAADELDKVMGGTAICGNIVGQYLAHAAGKRAALFAVNIEHSRFIRDRFLAAGVPAEHVDGETPKDEREAIFARLASGETLVLCNCNVATEGWDCPPLELVILARPTKSLVLALQMIGRGLRTFPGKTVCRIHDHAGIIPEHGLPDTERDYSLTSDTRKKKDAPPLPLKTCGRCFAVYPGGKPWPNPCPRCGCVEEKPEIEPIEEIDHAQVRAVPISELPAFTQAPVQKQIEMYKRFVEQGRARGYKRGFAAAKFKALFGRWPERSWG